MADVSRKQMMETWKQVQESDIYKSVTEQLQNGTEQISNAAQGLPALSQDVIDKMELTPQEQELYKSIVGKLQSAPAELARKVEMPAPAEGPQPKPYIPPAETMGPPADHNQIMINNMSPQEAFFVGAGEEFNKLGSGLNMLGTYATQFGSKEALSKARKRLDDIKQNKQYMDPLVDEHPLAVWGGRLSPYLVSSFTGSAPEVLPGIATRLNTAAAKLPGASQVGKMAELLNPEARTIGGLPTKLSYAGKLGKNELIKGTAGGTALGLVHPDVDPLVGPAAGAGGGYLSRLLGSFITAPKGFLNDTEKSVVNWAKTRKLYTTPGMRSGNPREQMLSHAFRTNPKTAEIFQEKLSANEPIEASIVGNLFGDPHMKDLGPTNLAAARDTVKRTYQDLSGLTAEAFANKGSRPIGEAEIVKLQNILKRNKSLFMPNEDIQLIHSAIKPLLSTKGQSDLMMPGGYQAMREGLTDAIASAQKQGKPQLRKQLVRIREVLSDAVGDPKLAQKWAENDQRYALLSEFSPLVANGGVGRAELGSLPQYLSATDPVRFLMTDPKKLSEMSPDIAEFYNLARYHKMVQGQHGASLGASQAVTNMMKPETGKETLMNLLMNRTFIDEVPIYRQLAAKAYLSNLPPRLPFSAGEKIGKIGRRVGERTGTEPINWAREAGSNLAENFDSTYQGAEINFNTKLEEYRNLIDQLKKGNL